MGARVFTDRRVVLLAALVGVGAVLGYWAAFFFDDRILPGVSVAGTPVGGVTSAEARDILAKKFGSVGRKPVTLTFEERAWRVSPPAVGIELDYAATIARAVHLGRHGGLVTRLRQRRLVAKEGRDLALVFKIEEALWDNFCRALEGEINVVPVDAHLSVDAGGGLHVSPSRPGRALDRGRLARILKESFLASNARVYPLPVNVLKPSLSEEEIAGWPLDQVLGFYVTKFDPADEQRTHNLRLAAQAIDGVIVRPDDEFSFNAFVGPRAPEKGYLEAPVIQRNRLVLGMGGGVCQVSSTLFNAVLLAGLPVRKRANHTQPSTYVPLGRDATVVFDAVDFVFANDSGRPVVIAAETVGARLVVAVVGHRDARPRVEIAVEIKESIPFTTEIENDPGLAAGVEAVVQQGREGYKVQLWRTITWPDRSVIREAIGPVAYYPPVKRLIKRGIGSPRFGMKPLVRTEKEPTSSETGGVSP